MSYLHPMTFVFILIIVFCAGWCGGLWWMQRLLRRRIIKTAEVTKHWSVH